MRRGIVVVVVVVLVVESSPFLFYGARKPRSSIVVLRD